MIRILLTFMVAAGIHWFFMPSVATSFAAEHTLTVEVDEPTTNANAGTTPLDDLALMLFKITKADGSDWIAPVPVVATSPAGGGHHKITMKVLGVDGKVETGTLSAEAVDTSGNVSAPITVLVPIDGVAPGQPMNIFYNSTTTGP